MLYSFRRVLLTFVLCIAAGNLFAREITITDPGHLGAINDANAGDTVILKNGTWKDAIIRVSKGGRQGQPVVIRAETPGGVVLSGASVLIIDAPFVTVDGLSFLDGCISKGAVIVFKSHHGVVRNTAIKNYNPPDYRTAYNWVLFSGPDNVLDRCFFEGKTNLHAVVENGEPGCRHNAVTGCYFKNIPLRAKVNGREIVKVLGVGHVNASTPDGAYFTLEGNLFDHTDGEGVEVISLKSNFNRVLRNTIVASVGSLNIRRGSDNEIRGNVILGQGVSGAQGIRMSGQRNLIAGNFVSDCDFGIAVSSGEFWEKPLTPAYRINDRDGVVENKARYPQNRNVTITGNVTVGISGADLDVGVREYKKHWPENQNVLLPEECKIEHNVFVRLQGGVSVIGMAPDRKPPLDQFTFKANTFADNVLYGGKNDYAAAASGVRESPVPSDWSKAVVTESFKPLTAADVGPDWMHAKPL